MAYKEKFLDTVITEAGRHLLLGAGAGEGTIKYTRAVLSSQSVRHLDPNDSTGKTVTGLDDEAIRKITKPDDELRSTELLVSPILDNTITVSASWDNNNLADDIKFNSIFWFAKLGDNPEIVLGITPTVAQDEILAAGSPDHRSTEAINCDLDMAISNAAEVDMTVNEAGTVKRGELSAWITKIKDGLDQEIKAECDKIQITVNGNAYKQDANRNITLPVVLKDELDKAIAGVKITINGVAPDKDGNFDLSSSKLIQGLTSTIKDLTDKITGLQTLVAAQDQRLDYIENNYLEGKRFNVADDDAAMKWEKEKITRIAMMVDDSATPPISQPTQSTTATKPSTGDNTSTKPSDSSGTTTNK